MTLVMIIMNVMVLLLLTGIAWTLVRRDKPQLSAIERELRSIAARLEQLPGESSLRELLSAQEKQLRGIGEQLHSHPDTELLHRYLQDQTNQLLAIISTHEAGDKPELTHADLEDAVRLTNQQLERVLWSLRFDEAIYEGSSELKKDVPEALCRETKQNPGSTVDPMHDDRDAAMLADSLKTGGDGYQAMLDYMRTTGRSGTDALQALEMAKVMHRR
jgi:hypothetical protein